MGAPGPRGNLEEASQAGPGSTQTPGVPLSWPVQPRRRCWGRSCGASRTCAEAVPTGPAVTGDRRQPLLAQGTLNRCPIIAPEALSKPPHWSLGHHSSAPGKEAGLLPAWDGGLPPPAPPCPPSPTSRDEGEIAGLQPKASARADPAGWEGQEEGELDCLGSGRAWGNPHSQGPAALLLLGPPAPEAWPALERGVSLGCGGRGPQRGSAQLLDPGSPHSSSSGVLAF